MAFHRNALQFLVLVLGLMVVRDAVGRAPWRFTETPYKGPIGEFAAPLLRGG
jgi:hypothetical protein